MQSQELSIPIVKILLTDVYLLENRFRFLDSLSLCANDRVTINKINDNYEFFSSALNRWILITGPKATVDKLCEILRSNEFKHVAEQLEAQYSSRSTPIGIDPEPTVSFEVSEEVPNFTGREKELKHLQDLFFGNKEYVATITGMGGIGKSELAKRFASLMHKEYNVTTIWFSGQNREILEASVNRLAKQIGAKPVAETVVVKKSKNRFTSFISNILSFSNKRKLVIIDNVDEANKAANSIIKSKIPENDCFFLVTSRNLKVLQDVGQIIELGSFTDQEAHLLVSTSLETETHEDIKRLCVLLQNFPLALQQAVAYIKEQGVYSLNNQAYKISKYVDSFINQASKKKELLGHKLNLKHGYELTTLITWQMTMDKIRKFNQVGELAMKILNSIAYFEPDRIHVDLLQLFFKEEEEVEKAIQLIQTYSLVKVKDRFICIHRLLQQVIQINTSEKCMEVQHLRELTHSIAKILEDGENEIRQIQPKLVIDDDSSNVCDFDIHPVFNCIRSGIGHILSVWNHNCKYPELMTEFKRIPIKIIDVVHPVWRKVSRIDDITNFTGKNLSLFKATFGINAIESLELGIEVTFASISVLNANQLEEIYTSQRSIIGEDNLLNLRLLEKIAYYIVSQCSGHYSVFDKYLREYLKLLEKIMSPGHQVLPVPLQLIKRVRGKDPESAEEWAQLLEDAKILWGQHNHHTLTIMNQYGIFLFRNKKMVKAKEIYERWLRFKGTEKTKEVTEAKCRLSDIQYILGDRESALQTLQQAEVGWDFCWEREKKPKKLFVKMRSECERADRKVREGHLEDALRLYRRVNDYQKSKNYPFYSLYYTWWRMETSQKRASILIQLRRYKEALHILQYKVLWDRFVVSDHKLRIEKKKLLKKAEEGLRLA